MKILSCYILLFFVKNSINTVQENYINNIESLLRQEYFLLDSNLKFTTTC
jgi:hypothetical protein